MPGLDGLVEIVFLALWVSRAKAQDRTLPIRFSHECQHGLRVQDAIFVLHGQLDDPSTAVRLFQVNFVGGGQQRISFCGLSIAQIDCCQFARLINGSKQRFAALGFLFPDRVSIDKQLDLIGVGIDLHHDGLAFIIPVIPASKGI